MYKHWENLWKMIQFRLSKKCHPGFKASLDNDLGTMAQMCKGREVTGNDHYQPTSQVPSTVFKLFQLIGLVFFNFKLQQQAVGEKL